jgi:hypothetical protein
LNREIDAMTNPGDLSYPSDPIPNGPTSLFRRMASQESEETEEEAEESQSLFQSRRVHQSKHGQSQRPSQKSKVTLKTPARAVAFSGAHDAALSAAGHDE